MLRLIKMTTNQSFMVFKQKFVIDKRNHVWSTQKNFKFHSIELKTNLSKLSLCFNVADVLLVSRSFVCSLAIQTEANKVINDCFLIHNNKNFAFLYLHVDVFDVQMIKIPFSVHHFEDSKRTLCFVRWFFVILFGAFCCFLFNFLSCVTTSQQEIIRTWRLTKGWWSEALTLIHSSINNFYGHKSHAFLLIDDD